MAITKVTSGGLSDIAAAVEGASDSNKFTDADHTKLNAIEASATTDQTKSDIEGLGIDVPAANLTGTIADARFPATLPTASAANLTAIPAANITGTLPAISGANLTGLSSFDPDGAVVFNESGADVDFRVEADDDANALFIEGANGNVGVGNTATQGELSVTTGGTNASGHTAGFQVRHNGYSGYKSGMSAGDTADTTHNCGFIGFLGAGHTGAGERHITFETRAGTTDAAGTERLRITSDGRGLSQFTAKAWVNFHGTGTPAINDSHNISSITDINTGNYRANFTNTMANNNYSYCGAVGEWDCTVTGNTPNTSYAPCYAINIGSGGLIDKNYVMVLVFGD